MKRSVGQMTVWWKLALLAVLPVLPAQGEVTDVSGTVTTIVIQYHGGSQAQRDFSQETVPLTTPTLPAVARARLDRLLPDGEVTAAGQVVAVLDNPNLTGSGPPNDAGLDLGAFSDDSMTSWSVEGVVTERRTIVLRPAELGGGLTVGARAQVEGSVLLSGVMLITAMDPNKDLSEVEVRLEFSVTRPELNGSQPGGQVLNRHQSQDQHADEGGDVLLEGSVVLAGGPDGTVEVENSTGVLEGVSLPVVDFVDFPEELPLISAVLFTGLDLRYEYEVIVGQQFALELSVRTQVLAAPDGTGAAAVFGLPQEGFGSVFARVKGSDRGHQLAAIISRHVDTTGQAYQKQSWTSPVPFFFPLCGATGIEVVGLTLMGGGLMLMRVGRRRIANGKPRTSDRRVTLHD